MEVLGTHRLFGGTLHYVQHRSAVTKTMMTLSVFVPSKSEKLPALTWLSGLTCTHDNFTTKAGAYKRAAQLGLIIIAPDTSPRGKDIANSDDYDLGQGAGFYLDATQEPWSEHFQMYSYVSKELQQLTIESFPIDHNRQGIFGHSMGGHGALTIGLKHPEIYKSISAFAPIVAPTQTPWGQKAFNHYLGNNKEYWKRYDACELVKQYGNKSQACILIDQGLADDFYTTELKPHLFQEACNTVDQSLNLRLHEGYDHSYFFIHSFIDDHLDHHFSELNT